MRVAAVAQNGVHALDGKLWTRLVRLFLNTLTRFLSSVWRISDRTAALECLPVLCTVRRKPLIDRKLQLRVLFIVFRHFFHKFNWDTIRCTVHVHTTYSIVHTFIKETDIFIQLEVWSEEIIPVIELRRCKTLLILFHHNYRLFFSHQIWCKCNRRHTCTWSKFKNWKKRSELCIRRAARCLVESCLDVWDNITSCWEWKNLAKWKLQLEVFSREVIHSCPLLKVTYCIEY